MRSLQGRLSRGLLLGMGALLIVAGLLVDQEIERRTLAEFDQALEDRARALAGLVEIDEGHILLEFEPAEHPEFMRSASADYFELREIDGETLYLSDSASGRPLPEIEGKEATRTTSRHNLVLPDGRRGRALVLRFHPRLEPPDEESVSAEPAVSNSETSVRIELILARERVTLDTFIGRVRSAMTALVLGLLAAATGLIAWILHRELAPVRTFAALLTHVDAESLGTPLEPAGMPAELAPIVARVDELMRRLHASFERERAFSMHLAHELRTPLAELRALVDVTLLWPDDPRELAIALKEIGAVQWQMESLIANLLALARSSTGAVEGGGRPTTTSVDLHAAVARALELVRETCSEREIEAVNAVSAPSPALAPPADLDMVLSNLAQNAALHAPRRSRTQVRFVSSSGTLVWTNSAPDLDASDLPHLFDPFWR
ncbi:MAG: histidine kinase dimerization/phospho-acceptor domain-containing protein, partial [Thermoanaerobaculia bacterium]